MSDAWLPLPTRDGWWWCTDCEGNVYDSPFELVGCYGGEPDQLCERDSRNPVKVEEGVLWKECPVPPPPADAGKLPRRFRWNDFVNEVVIDGVHFRVFDGEMPCCLFYGPGLSVWKPEQWLSDHAAEIEWIDP